MNSKIDLNYLLFWKNHNFHMACPMPLKKALALMCA